MHDKVDVGELLMRTSDSVGEIFGAIAKAQALMDPAIKGKRNPFYKSSYADLACCFDALRNAFSPQGLAIVQVPTIQAGRQYLTTMIGHSSGEYIRGVYMVNPTKGDPQALGSAMTYARRYSLCAMCGLATKDDDGNAASGKAAPIARPQRQPSQPQQPAGTKQQPMPPKQQPTPKQQPAKTDKPLSKQQDTDPLTEGQRKFMFSTVSNDTRLVNPKHFLHFAIRKILRPASPLDKCGVSTLSKREGMKLLDAFKGEGREKLIAIYLGGGTSGPEATGEADRPQESGGSVQSAPATKKKVSKKRTTKKVSAPPADDDGRPEPTEAPTDWVDPDEIPF